MLNNWCDALKEHKLFNNTIKMRNAQAFQNNFVFIHQEPRRHTTTLKAN